MCSSNTGGAGWTSLGLHHNSAALVVDPTNALQVYAGTDAGVYKSTDGGGTWNYSGLNSIWALAIDPANPCSLYALNNGSYIYSSSNCGGSWPFLGGPSGLSGLSSLVIAGRNPAVVWAAGSGTLLRVTGCCNSSDWIGATALTGAVLAADPANICTAYLGNSSGSVYKKTACSGDDWPWPDTGAAFGSAVTAIAAHPTDQATVLAGTANGSIYKKVGAGSWNLMASLSGPVLSILFHPANPLNVYAATVGGLVYSSSNGGSNWSPPVAVSAMPRVLAASATAPSTVYLASAAQSDAFAAKLSPAGAITYATLLGGSGTDTAYGVALDPQGAAYVAGQTTSSDFPTTTGVFPVGPGGGTDGFLAKFNPATPVSITVKTNPAGLSFVADGATYTAQQTFNWLADGSHSISVVSPQAEGGGLRYVFANWSDGGAATHTIIAPSGATTYTANFNAQYLLTVQPSIGGIVTPNPTSSDGYYNTGASVQLTALPTFGYAFTSWNGDLSGSTNPQSVTMTAAHTVGATFATAPVVGLRFVPVTPCRVVDTRTAAGPFGGPAMTAASTRSFAVPQSGCGIPPTAQAYSLNVTVVPQGPLAYLSLWPTGQTQAQVSTLNSWGGITVANAAIVPAGSGGAISIYVTNPTDVIVDINGYFDAGNGANEYSFYPATPCRVADTRGAAGPFGGPTMTAEQSRDFAVPASGCGMPAGASAYSLNFTVVPKGYLGYLTTWPAGQAAPVASTLNSWTGKVVANAALVPAGTSGAISVYVSNPTDVILDTNGYFAAPGSAGALSFYPVTPCRVADTRNRHGLVRRPGDGGHDDAYVPDSVERLRDPGDGGGVFAERNGGAGRLSGLPDGVAGGGGGAGGLDAELVGRQRGGERGHRAGGDERRDQRVREQPHAGDPGHQRVLRALGLRRAMRSGYNSSLASQGRPP